MCVSFIPRDIIIWNLWTLELLTKAILNSALNKMYSQKEKKKKKSMNAPCTNLGKSNNSKHFLVFIDIISSASSLSTVTSTKSNDIIINTRRNLHKIWIDIRTLFAFIMLNQPVIFVLSFICPSRAVIVSLSSLHCRLHQICFMKFTIFQRNAIICCFVCQFLALNVRFKCVVVKI